MPSAHIVVESSIEDSFRVAAMRGLFDVPIEEKNRHEWDINIPIEDNEWNIGLMIGASGSGKTTCVKQLFGNDKYHNEFKWDRTKAIIDCFPKELSVQDITNLLSHVGFSSPPSWTKSYQVLSTGQKFRVEMARILAEDKELVVIDEFTSVIDRNAAMIGSYAVSKAIRRNNKKVVCVSCHRDILEWLEPDWIYDMDINQFARRRLRRPCIKLELYKVNRKAWSMFKEHHYLTRDISKSAPCYVAYWNDVPVAFTSIIGKIGFKNSLREHRTVVLPDYQGVGIGNAISEMMGDMIIARGLRYYSTTSHPAFAKHRCKSKKWRLIRNPSRSSRDRKRIGTTATDRLTVSFEYIGEPDNNVRTVGIAGQHLHAT